MPPWSQLDQTLAMDEYFIRLSYQARLLYHYMMLHAGADADEWFPFTANVAEKYGFPRSTFQKAAKELVTAGLLESKRGGIMDGWTNAQYSPTLYRASYTAWKNREPLKINGKTKKKN